MRAIVWLLAVLTGCATQQTELHTLKDSWNGAVYDDVVSRWGPPNRYTTLSDGAYVYTWESESMTGGGRVYPSFGIFGGSGGGVGVGTGVTFGGGGGELVRCDRTFIFRNGRVAEQTWQGEPGFCERFKR